MTSIYLKCEFPITIPIHMPHLIGCGPNWSINTTPSCAGVGEGSGFEISLQIWSCAAAICSSKAGQHKLELLLRAKMAAMTQMMLGASLGARTASPSFSATRPRVFVARAASREYGVWLPDTEPPAHLTGELPGDFGYRLNPRACDTHETFSSKQCP